MTVAIQYASCSNDDSASEDGSEPPSPRAITAAQAPTSTDAAESMTTNVEPAKDKAEEEDPMVNSKPGNVATLMNSARSQEHASVEVQYCLSVIYRLAWQKATYA